MHGRNRRKERTVSCSMMLLLLVAIVVAASGQQCPSLQHLTNQGNNGANSLPPLVYSVRASSYSSSNPPEELFAFTYPSSFYTWCSTTFVPPPYNVTINMTEPVILYELLSGGYRLSTLVTTPLMTVDYVTSFSLDYLETDDGDIMSYQHQMVFHVPGPNLSVLPLPQPLVAKIFNFHILNYVGSRACLTLAFIGCRLSEATMDPIPSPSPSPSPPPTTPSNAETETNCQSDREGDNSQAVTTAVSTATATVLAVGVMVIVGIALCWRITNKHTFACLESKNKQPRERASTLRTVENDLYTDPNNSQMKSSGYRGGSDDNGTEEAISTTTQSHVMAEQTQMYGYEPVEPGNTGGSESLTNNPAYLTTSTLAHSAQQEDVGYELIRTPPPKLQQRQADS